MRYGATRVSVLRQVADSLVEPKWFVHPDAPHRARRQTAPVLRVRAENSRIRWLNDEQVEDLRGACRGVEHWSANHGLAAIRRPAITVGECEHAATPDRVWCAGH